MGLAEQIEAYHRGEPDPEALLAALRADVVLVPVDDNDAVITGEYQGLRWLYAFTSEAELARFISSGEGTDHGGGYVTVRGWRVIDEFLPALPQPCGVVVDVASPRPMTFPPVRGIVPDAIAVDAAPEGG